MSQDVGRISRLIGAKHAQCFPDEVAEPLGEGSDRGMKNCGVVGSARGTERMKRVLDKVRQTLAEGLGLVRILAGSFRARVNGLYRPLSQSILGSEVRSQVKTVRHDSGTDDADGYSGDQTQT